jgi:hypothetical protein
MENLCNTEEKNSVVAIPRERAKKNKIVAQTRGYESENDREKTKGALMPAFGMKQLETPKQMKELQKSVSIMPKTTKSVKKDENLLTFMSEPPVKAEPKYGPTKIKIIQ